MTRAREYKAIEAEQSKITRKEMIPLIASVFRIENAKALEKVLNHANLAYRSAIDFAGSLPDQQPDTLDEMQECLGRVLTLFNYPNNYERLVQATGKTNSKAAEKIILSLEQSVLELHALAEKAHTPIDRRDFEKVYLLNPITILAEYWVGTLKRKFSANFNHAKYEPISESANFIYAAFCYFEHDSIVNGNRDKLKVALHGFLRNLRKAKQFVEKSERDSLPETAE